MSITTRAAEADLMTIIPFTFSAVTLDNAGGKGANLARLARAGFPVPRGFIISTECYRTFVTANRLAEAIQSSLANLSDDTDALEHASQAIRAAFSAGALPAEIEADIIAAFADLQLDMAGGHAANLPLPVAVRSSATAKDLPDLSFAGHLRPMWSLPGASKPRWRRLNRSPTARARPCCKRGASLPRRARLTARMIWPFCSWTSWKRYLAATPATGER